MLTRDPLTRTLLQRLLDYHLVEINYEKVKKITITEVKAIIKQILEKQKFWNFYKDKIKSIKVEQPYLSDDWVIDLQFTDFVQIKYRINLTDDLEPNPYPNNNLILDLRVIYNSYKNN